MVTYRAERAHLLKLCVAHCYLVDFTREQATILPQAIISVCWLTRHI